MLTQLETDGRHLLPVLATAGTLLQRVMKRNTTTAKVETHERRQSGTWSYVISGLQRPADELMKLSPQCWTRPLQVGRCAIFHPWMPTRVGTVGTLSETSQLISSRMLHQFLMSTGINQHAGKEHVLLPEGRSGHQQVLLDNSDKPDGNICISIKYRGRPNLSLWCFQGSSPGEQLWELLKKQMAPTSRLRRRGAVWGPQKAFLREKLLIVPVVWMNRGCGTFLVPQFALFVPYGPQSVLDTNV